MQDKKNFTVLARKYRPDDFSTLIGQEVLVKTISNAIRNDKVPHAFLLTGIRGVGKTTTARIIAKLLNCENSDKSAENINPCNICPNCIEISESRHPDVIEMDAASKTGVDDIRDVIDNCGYAPISARYKIYIIDEVHMLSNNAFNALLKTLEEPPAHVKFIFATTEVKKIPLTIISRCQRFDLKKINNEQLISFLADICQQEEVNYDAESLKLITNLSGGSVRDSLSLLDQIISLSNNNVNIEIIRNSLGLSSKANIIELYSYLIQADTDKTLNKLAELENSGIEAKYILQDLLEITHYLSKFKSINNQIEIDELDADSIAKLKEMSKQINLAALTVIWQMLLKGTEELSYAFNSFKSLEMLIIRILFIDKELNFKNLFQTAQADNSEIKKKSLA